MTAKNRDQLRNPTLGNRVWATYILQSIRGFAIMRYINLLLTLTLRNVSIHPVLIAARVSECCCFSYLPHVPYTLTVNLVTLAAALALSLTQS